jgi:hypothetical protein
MDDLKSERLGAAGRMLEPPAREPRDLPGGRRRPPPAGKQLEREDELDVPVHQVDRLV